MAFIKGGCFEMGDVFGEGKPDERPVHRVCVDDFYLGAYEVTQEQWRRVMGDDPAMLRTGDAYPVETVSWNDVQAFIHELNVDTAKGYRLPTEAEWEYAAREGGKKVRFGTGTDCVSPATANYESRTGSIVVSYFNSGPSSRGMTQAGSFRPNSLGLYDMSGNVWEWTGDGYDADYYRNSVSNNPKGPASSGYRVVRGGSWGTPPWNLRITKRTKLRPWFRIFNVGFRLAMSVPKP